MFYSKIQMAPHTLKADAYDNKSKFAQITDKYICVIPLSLHKPDLLQCLVYVTAISYLHRVYNDVNVCFIASIGFETWQ